MPLPMEAVIKNAQKHGYAPLRYPAGGLIRRRCPECWGTGAILIFRHQTDDGAVDIYACQCGYRQLGY